MSGPCFHRRACPVGQWCGPNDVLRPSTSGNSDAVVLLVGNPNVGKSVLFHRLTGRYATVSNYPGTTIEREEGEGSIGDRLFRVIDIPGVAGPEPVSDDERIALETVREFPDGVLVIVGDAKQLRRTVSMALTFRALRYRMVVALNMMDEARALGCDPDVSVLAQELGMDVVACVATTGEGVERLKESIVRAVPYTGYQGEVSPSASLEEAAQHIMAAALAHPPHIKGESPRQGWGDAMIRPLTGIPILLGVLYAMYVFVGQFGAGTCVKWMEEVVFGSWINPFVTAGSRAVWGTSWFADLLVGPYGLVTMGIAYAFAIVLPVMTAFFLMFGFLEDVGYLPRLTILADRFLRMAGLHGKAVLPSVLGFGCGTMAVLTTRILESPKERMIATLVIGLAIPCSAQLGVTIGLASHISGWALIVIGLILASQFLLVGRLAASLFPGERSDFVIELPPLRIPQVSNIVRKTLIRVKWYLQEAVPFFLAGTLLLFILDRTGGLEIMERVGAPVVQRLLGLPAEATRVLMLGFFRRDYGAAGLFDLAKRGVFTPIQVMVSLVTITLFIPCIASFFVMVKERGLKAALGLLGFITPYAIAIGALTNLALRRLPW